MLPKNHNITTKKPPQKEGENKIHFSIKKDILVYKKL
jgi:hypothetical protein